MFRNPSFIVVLLTIVLSACSGGGGETASPQPIPTASVSGAAVDGLVFNGTVSVYDFSTGSKGALLGQATTNINTGLYSLTIQTESRPLLLELTGGYYYEEMDPTRQVQLDPSDKLLALVNFTTGQSINSSVTNYTTLSTGLAQYRIANGTAVAVAINDANSRISALIGTNISTTTPREITDPANASAALTPALQYGFLAGGISMWAYNNPPSLALRLTKPYVSIKFIQLMYQDVVADGLLDGVGKDGSGNNVNLSFGIKALGADVYRKGIAVNVLLMADHVNNRTGLSSSHVLSFASAYGASTDPIWGGVAPTPITAPVVNLLTPTANQWLRSTVNVTATATDYSGLSSANLLVDGNSTATITTGLLAPMFSYNTTAVPDGDHTMGVRVTNVLGQATDAVVPVSVDNTPPVAGITGAVMRAGGCVVSGVAYDTGSGVIGTPISGYICSQFGCAATVTGVVSSGAWSLVLPVSPDLATVYVSLNDDVGNVGTASRNLFIPRGTSCQFR